MASQEVKLVGMWVSPFVRKVEWALKLKGVDYEYIEEEIYDKSPLLLGLNPIHKKVPVLVHNGKVIAESVVILEYIDETWKQIPLLPQDPYQRTKARFWANFIQEKFWETAWSAWSSQGEEKDKALSLAIEALVKIEEELKEGEFKGKLFLGGDKIGYLDIVIGWISYWVPVWEEVGSVKIVDPFKFPATTAWMNNFLNHPLIKHNLPPREEMLVFFHKLGKKIASTPHP